MTNSSANDNFQANSDMDVNAQPADQSAYTKMVGQIFFHGTSDDASVQALNDAQLQTGNLASNAAKPMSVDELLRGSSASVNPIAGSFPLSEEAWAKPASGKKLGDCSGGGCASGSKKGGGDDSGGGPANLSHFSSDAKTGYGFLLGWKGLAARFKGNNFYNGDDDEEEEEK